jgi:uncharacterized protein
MMATVQHDELDAGPRKSGPGSKDFGADRFRSKRYGAERFCAATRSVRSLDDLIRFVIGPDGVVPDIKRKLPGRGLWITADKATLKDAIARNVFARGFKSEVRATAELLDLTERLLVRAALDTLAMAGKSGLVVAGFGKVETAITRDRIAGLIHASGAGADGKSKLAGMLRRRADSGQVPVVSLFTTAQLDLALGRSNVVHAALLVGPACDAFLAHFARIERFRTGGKSPVAAAVTELTGFEN